METQPDIRTLGVDGLEAQGFTLRVEEYIDASPVFARIFSVYIQMHYQRSLMPVHIQSVQKLCIEDKVYILRLCSPLESTDAQIYLVKRYH